MGANLKAVSTEEYKLQEGVFNKDNSFVTADYSNVEYNNKHNIGDVFAVVGESIAHYVGNAITSVKDSIVNGVQNGLATVKGTVTGWFVRITTFNAADENIAIMSLSENVENKVETVGDLYIVEVFDENDNLVDEFSDKPVELKLSYDISMLSNNNEDGLAIYYWDEDSCTYAKIDGIIDKESKDVTANITKSGQYVLGVDLEPPVIENINYYDTSITTSIYDSMSGIDSNSIELIVDDVNVLDGANASKYYNTYTGYFSYPIGADFAKSSYNVVITAKDNSGNTASKEAKYSNGSFDEKITETTTESTTTTVTVTETTTETTTKATTTTEIITKATTETTTETTTEAATVTTTEASTETTTTAHRSGGSGAGATSIIVSGYTAKATTEASTETTTIEKTEVTTDESAVKSDVKVTIGSKQVIIGTKAYDMDVAPYIQSSSNSTLVPLRFVALAIADGNIDDADNSENILWDNVSKTATIIFGNKTIKFTAGSNTMVIDGKSQIMDNGVKAEIKEGRMFVPFRALGNALGVDVEWDADTKTATYSTK